MRGLLPHGLSWSDSERSVWKPGYCREKWRGRECGVNPRRVSASHHSSLKLTCVYGESLVLVLGRDTLLLGVLQLSVRLLLVLLLL